MKKLSFRCMICKKIVKNRIAHFWRHHYKTKQYHDEANNSEMMMADIDNKYFEGVTINR